MRLYINNNNNNSNDIIFNIILILSTFIFASLFISSSLFLINFPIKSFYAPIFFIFSLICSFLYSKKTYTLLKASIISIILISYYISIYFYDVSWDGQAYHQDFIRLLKNGWIPIKETNLSNHNLLANHYQKGIEIIQTVFYSFSNKMESGKTLNFLFLIISSLFAYKVLNLFFFKKILSIIFSFSIVLCPVVIYQILTYYIDFIYYLNLICLISCVILFIKKKKVINISLFIFFSVILCSIKFSTIPTYIILLFATFLYLLISLNFVLLKKLFISCFIILVASLIVNYNPLITNLIQGKNIFYPLMGKGKIEIMSFNTPEKLLSENRFKKFIYSTISKSGYDYKKKIPFIKGKGEELSLTSADIRLGGFGILFSGILILSIIICIYSLFLKNKTQITYIIYYIMFWIIVSIVINPEFWWARYAPQLWLIPILSLLLVWNIKNYFITLIKYLSLICIYINLFYFISANLMYNIKKTNEINAYIEKLKKSNNEILIDDYFFNTPIRLKENNINYKIIKLNKNFQYTPNSFEKSKYYIPK